MSTAVSRGQALEVSSRVATQICWDEIDGDRLQAEVISLSSAEFGQRFTDFLKQGARPIIGKLITLSIDRSTPFDLVKLLGDGWSIWRGPADGDGLSGEEEQDSKSLALTEITPDLIRLDTSLKSGERSITGEEKRKRLLASGQILLDAQIFQALLQNPQFIPDSWKGEYIYFPGTTLRRPSGDRNWLSLCWRGGQWSWRGHWLCRYFDDGGPAAVLASYFVSPLQSLAGFCF